MEIEVEWKGVASGLSQIDISEMGCKNEKEWNELSKDEQRERINKWQNENEPAVEYKQTDWYKI